MSGKILRTAIGATAACTISTYEGHRPTAARAIDILVGSVYGKVASDELATCSRSH